MNMIGINMTTRDLFVEMFTTRLKQWIAQSLLDGTYQEVWQWDQFKEAAQEGVREMQSRAGSNPDEWPPLSAQTLMRCLRWWFQDHARSYPGLAKMPKKFQRGRPQLQYYVAMPPRAMMRDLLCEEAPPEIVEALEALDLGGWNTNPIRIPRTMSGVPG